MADTVADLLDGDAASEVPVVSTRRLAAAASGGRSTERFVASGTGADKPAIGRG